jgi:putative spermidine/putrescine transport system permease protein
MTNSASSAETRSYGRQVGFYGLIIALVLLLVLPTLSFVFNAFSERWFYPQFIPNQWSLAAWETLLRPNMRVLEAIGNSFLIAASVTVVSILIGLPAARVLGLEQFRGKRWVELLIFAPTIVPGIVYSMGLSINFIRLGLSGTLLGVILVHFIPVMPYVVLTLAGVFANYNTQYEEQARTLGASPLIVLRDIMLPAIFPGLVVAGLFAFIVSWSQYILTFLIGGGRVVTIPVLLFAAVPGGNNPTIAAMGLVFVAPMILILLLTSRYLSGRSAVLGGLR